MTLLRLFLASTARLLLLGLQSLWPGVQGPSGGRGPAWGRVLVMIGFVPLFALVQLIHWIGFLLDEILFPGYRRVEIKEPLFVLGVPRSGTTHLHRVLARDQRFTTFSTWECLFALSVTERRFWLGLGRLDALVGGPLRRLLDWLERRVFGAIAEVHSMSLRDPEEDYFSLMPVLACFILILPFPADTHLWRMGTFDRDMPAPERRRLMAFYRGCLKRHLYVHGTDKRLLSKNAAFAPLAGTLRETFPDARFLVCLREPTRTLPSQLSSVEAGLRLFGVLRVAPDFRCRLVRQLGFYYENLERVLGGAAEHQCTWITMQDLKADLTAAVTAVYRRLDLPMDDGFRERLDVQAAQARGYRSGHSYSLEQFGLTPETIDRDLTEVYGSLAARSVLASVGSGGRAATATGAIRGGHREPDQITDSSAPTQPALPC
ncbi:MAG: sulfotransferase [Pseudomonadota bacterium]|nr:sulfotransferase [Pseudomonadota bacterium]